MKEVKPSMPAQVTNYQCPSCTGPLHFVGASGKLECDYCGASYDVAEIEALYAEKEEKAAAAQQAEEKKAEEKQAAEKQEASADGGDWDTSGFSEDWGEEGERMKAYSCPSCGAELLCDESTAATSCPYCGNPTVVPGAVLGRTEAGFHPSVPARQGRCSQSAQGALQGKNSPAQSLYR